MSENEEVRAAVPQLLLLRDGMFATKLAVFPQSCRPPGHRIHCKIRCVTFSYVYFGGERVFPPQSRACCEALRCGLGIQSFSRV